AAVAGLLLLEGDLLARLPKAKRRYDLRHLPQGARRQRGVVQKLDASMRPLCDSEPPDPLRVTAALGVAVLDLDADGLVLALRDQGGATLSHARQVDLEGVLLPGTREGGRGGHGHLLLL